MAENIFPTQWQRVIFTNYAIVPAKNIAAAIGTDEETVREHASLLGADLFAYCGKWLEKGFVTVIRNNYDILSDRQICVLLGLTQNEYAKLLNEYDFLSVKLGKKPETDEPEYFPLSSAQLAATRKIREKVEKYHIMQTAEPFDFFGAHEHLYIRPKDEVITDRFTSCYCANYSGALLDGELKDYSDDYLSRLVSAGANGIWLQETLRNIAPFPFEPSLSPDYEIRIKNLARLTERCAKHGIGVYLYLNEPRSLPEEFFGKYPDMKGQKAENGEYCMCTSSPQVREYVYDAVRFVVSSAPKLKGIFTITMSENPTHCHARLHAVSDRSDCLRCSKRQPEEVAAEINNIMCSAVKDANPDTLFIANLWGWSDFMGWDDERILRGIRLLDKRADVLCVSEFGKEFTRGGVKSSVIDYSISVIGPSAITVKMLSEAKRLGHRIWAKIQANNSWECSAVPFIPVFPRMTEHIENLKSLGVTGLMEGWSLGGFPGGALPLCNGACGKRKADAHEWYVLAYGENADIAEQAVSVMSEAFGEFPFSIENLYLGYHNMGPGNFWSLGKDGRPSTMVCYTFDDTEVFTQPYGEEIYILQYEKLCEKWKKGVGLLKSARGGNAFFRMTLNCAETVYVHYKSAALFVRFCMLKADAEKNKDEIQRIIKEEKELTQNLYSLVCADATIGFEMTNHYYYNAARLVEKLLILDGIAEHLEK